MDYLLDRIAQAQVEPDPYPHFVIRGYLNPDHYQAVEFAFPALEDFQDTDSLRESGRLTTGIGGEFDAGNTSLGIYLEFLRSEGFYEAVFDRFYREIKSRYWVSKRESHKLTSSIRFTVPSVDQDSAIPRGPHNDHSTTLFTALHYFRPADDRDEGGDLGLYTSKTGCPRTLKGKPRDYVADDVRLVKRVDYGANVLVCFLNTPGSIHGVTYRRSVSVRRYLSATVEFNRTLYWTRHPTLRMRLHRFALALRSKCS